MRGGCGWGAGAVSSKKGVLGGAIPWGGGTRDTVPCMPHVFALESRDG